MAAGQVAQHMVAGVTQISQHAEFELAVSATQLQGFTGIVGHRKRGQCKFAEINGLTVGGQTQQAIKIRAAQGRVCAPAHPYRDAVAQGELPGATNVVGVLVGDEDGVE